MTRYSALIFDLDGTLIDSAPDIAAALNVGFAQNGWPPVSAPEVEKFTGNGPHRLIRDILQDRNIPHDDAGVRRAFEAYLRAYLDDPAGRTRFYDNVPEDLAGLRNAGLRLGICTNKNHEVTGRVLAQLGLTEMFEVALGADVVPACKPDPGHLFAVADRMGLVGGSWAYIGDTVVDKATADAAGVPFYVVPWGCGPTVPVAASQRLTRLADLLRYAAVSTTNDG
ncbi:HAD family hydrolase [Paracoccus sp. (in: a-proteobacteria)]|uniref:HAD family hydrolase n=1 Tax=Paracoccus sp. TaxID=267 RepID=UPI003A84E843